MRVIGAEAIRAALNVPQAIRSVAEGFAAYSAGSVVVPPVGRLGFENPPGECHIKYGRVLDDDTFLIKIATGFPENGKLKLPNSTGLMLLFSAKSGRPLALLQDEGYLTDVRTAIAGTLCARYLAPRELTRIGIVGGGIQARYQLEYLQHATDSKDVLVWTRRETQSVEFVNEMAKKGFRVAVADCPASLCERCNLVITTTAATEPLLKAEWIRPGTHVTAMGSDGGGKQELDPVILQKADLCVVDSRAQCSAYGESHYALAAGCVGPEELVELGTIVSEDRPGRQNESDITIADLTGVAVQDIAVARVVWRSLAQTL